MKLSKEQFDKMKSGFEYIKAKFQDNVYIQGYKDTKEIKKQSIDTEDLLEFYFPSDDYLEHSVESFLEDIDEIKTIKLANNNSIIRTNSRAYYIINSDSIGNFNLRYSDCNFEKQVNENVVLKIVSRNLILCLASILSDKYSRKYFSTEEYLAIEVRYSSSEHFLTDEKELELVYSYIFEVTDTANFSIYFSQIEIPDELFLEEIELDQNDKLRELESFNEGMKLFISAMQIQEHELRFLNFYKILEYFGPIALNKEAFELMRMKLDAPKSNFEDGNFIKSIFTLAESTIKRINDEGLIKATFSNCFDFVGIFHLLPETIQKKVRKEIQEKEIDYILEKQKLLTASNMVGKIIYQTRNQVVHSKSNYNFTGNECEFNDLPQLNEFMKEASSQAIRWYNRLSKHLKFSIAN